MKYLIAILVALGLASAAQAGWWAEITFAPSQPGRGTVMVYRGDYVPYDIAYPNARKPQYNHYNRYNRDTRYNRHNPGHRR